MQRHEGAQELAVIVTNGTPGWIVVFLFHSKPDAFVLGGVMIFSEPCLKNSVDVGVMEKEQRIVASNGNILPKLVGDDQMLNDVSNAFLFHPWRRPEVVFREDNLSSLQDAELKASEKVRLELFPESYYCTENAI